MAHSNHEAAARAVKNSQKKVLETRSGDEILKIIRGNLGANLAVTPGDQRFLLGAYDAEKEFSHKLAEENVALKALVENGKYSVEVLGKSLLDRKDEIACLTAKIDEFRSVYEMENRSQTLRVEVVTATDPADSDVNRALDYAEIIAAPEAAL